MNLDDTTVPSDMELSSDDEMVLALRQWEELSEVELETCSGGDFQTMGSWGQAQGSGSSVQQMGSSGPVLVGSFPVSVGWGGFLSVDLVRREII